MPGPELSPETRQRLRVLFVEPDWVAAEQMLTEECGNNLPLLETYTEEQLQQVRFAALKVSGGSLAKLQDAMELAKLDWRDLIVAAFGWNTTAYERWEPRSPSERQLSWWSRLSSWRRR